MLDIHICLQFASSSINTRMDVRDDQCCSQVIMPASTAAQPARVQLPCDTTTIRAQNNTRCKFPKHAEMPCCTASKLCADACLKSGSLQQNMQLHVKQHFTCPLEVSMLCRCSMTQYRLLPWSSRSCSSSINLGSCNILCSSAGLRGLACRQSRQHVSRLSRTLHLGVDAQSVMWSKG